jgi:hypothetical protein
VTAINVDELVIFGLLKQQETALEAGDIVEARRLLEEISEELSKQYDWPKLKDPGPQSYEQLSDRLKGAGELLDYNGRAELRQLREDFEWCEEHGIGLAELQVSEHLPKYREAACYLNRICSSTEKDDESKVQEMRKALARIQSDQDRQAVRAWVRRPGQQGKKFDVGELR